MITRISYNNTATVKTPHGVKEYNYNTKMFKLFHPKKETIKEKEKEKHTKTNEGSEAKTKRQKKIYPSREDGGPTTRSKTAQEKVLSYAEVLKAPAQRLIKTDRPWWLSWLRRLSTNSKVEGSNPGGGIRIYFRDNSRINAHDRARTRTRMRTRNLDFR